MLASLALASGGLVLAGSPAAGYPYTIQVQQSGTAVTKSYFYREYRNDRTVVDSDFDAGRLRIRATPYRIDEDMKKYDQWLLHLKVSAKKKRGAMTLAWGSIYVEPRRYGKVSDSAATRDRRLGSCDPGNLKLNLGFGPISTSANVGKLRGCSQAMVDLTSHSTSTGATGWTVRNLKKLKNADVELYLQVPAGKEPNFRVTLTRPVDSCRADPGIPPSQCIPRDHDVTASFLVNGQT